MIFKCLQLTYSGKEPILSINDPDLLINMPAFLTSATGLDTLIHAIEGL